MLIMAAVGAFVVTVLAAYSQFSGQIGPLASLMPNMSSMGFVSAANGIRTDSSIRLYLPEITYVNQGSDAYLIAYLPPGYEIENMSGTSNGMDVLQGSYNGDGENPYVVRMGIVPRTAGNNTMNVSLVANREGNTIELTASSSTMSVILQTVDHGTVQASIARNNESLLYGYADSNPIENISVSTGCTKNDFWGSPYPIGRQCGDAFAYLRVFSDYCYNTYGASLTYCFYDSSTGNSIQQPGIAPSAQYNITVNVTANGYNMTSVLSSNDPSSRLLWNGSVVGNASVGSVDAHSSGGQADLILLSNGTVKGLSATDYQAFRQYLNSANSMLSYYNNTGVDPTTLSLVLQSVSAYDSYASGIGRTGGGTACTRVSNGISCPATDNFTYDIDARISGKVYAGNETLYVGGSRITVR